MSCLYFRFFSSIHVYKQSIHDIKLKKPTWTRTKYSNVYKYNDLTTSKPEEMLHKVILVKQFKCPLIMSRRPTLRSLVRGLSLWFLGCGRGAVWSLTQRDREATVTSREEQHRSDTEGREDNGANSAPTLDYCTLP